ncbi:DENN domain-containing protein 1B isoform X1 [Leptopilina heterotoma]|uniref:DENN domain-containing protein 1B isoform X1 n=1 Tax=Leptopilina heterotoma TaxID=63436 RepID=UPI001CA7EBF3|nr:DENN domain-containing protein 1B isoform X1 [Leptopilina heterotoma]
MGSRLRENVKHIFECFCEIAAPIGEKQAWILQKYPDTFADQEILKSVPKFAYPCEVENQQVQHFSFVLTSIDSKWTFGFCRHDPKTTTALVILSALPWHETFYIFLNHIATLISSKNAGDLVKFLEDVHNTAVPVCGIAASIPLPNTSTVFLCQSPKQFQLPSIPENRNLTEYFSAVDTYNMMIIFASMLYERRIVFTSKRLSRLSACVQACNALIYPMIWQHIYIPVLPLSLMDYLLAPMPFLIGVPSSTLQRVNKNDMGEVVVLDADSNNVDTPFHDLESLPQDVVTNLRKALRNRPALLGDGVSRAFLRALVQLTAGYREALTLQQGVRITFDPNKFVECRPLSMQPFLRKMLELQIFQQFIEERLHMLNSGLGFSDEFEIEACNYSDKSGSKFMQQYREWTFAMRKEGSAFIRSVKDKANPAVKYAVKSVKDKGKDMKTAYKGLKWKGRSSRAENSMRFPQPRSAPSSPTSERRAISFSSPSKSPSGFTATTSYRKELRLRNSNIDASRKQYSPLSPSSPEEPDSPPERLNIDLMHELRDVIFPNTPPVDRTLKPVRSLDSLRPAWSGRLRHGPLPISQNSFEIPPKPKFNPEPPQEILSNQLFNLESKKIPTNVKLKESIQNSSDFTNSKLADISPLIEISSNSKKNTETTTHEIINPSNPFANSEILKIKTNGQNLEIDVKEKITDKLLEDPFDDDSIKSNLQDPFDTSRVMIPMNPVLHSMTNQNSINSHPSQPLNTEFCSSHAKETSESQDLIRLDSTNSDDDFDPLLTKSRFNAPNQMSQSLNIPQMGEGLSNPLYPYFQPANQSSAELNQPQQHPEKCKDLDLLQEYGLDFNKFSLTNGAASSSSSSTSKIPSQFSQDFSENNFSINNSFGAQFSAQTVKSQNNWTKFE